MNFHFILYPFIKSIEFMQWVLASESLDLIESKRIEKRSFYKSLFKVEELDYVEIKIQNQIKYASIFELLFKPDSLDELPTFPIQSSTIWNLIIASEPLDDTNASEIDNYRDKES